MTNPANNLGRDSQHNPSSFFTSTARPLFDRVMEEAANNLRFDNIGLEDVDDLVEFAQDKKELQSAMSSTCSSSLVFWMIDGTNK